MSRYEFMAIFSHGIGSLPTGKRAEILGDISRHFEEGAAEGVDEGRLSGMLGDPAALAREYVAQEAVRRAEDRPTPHRVLRAVLAAAGIGALNLFIVLPMFIAVASVLIAFLMSGFAMVLSGIAAAGIGVAAFFVPMPWWVNIGDPVLAVIAGIFITAFGGLFMIGSGALSVKFGRFLVGYAKANINIITGEDHKA